MKQLDALRAIAVIGVVYQHFVWRRSPLPFFRDTINWGGIGVDLFFVLSGFLITKILLTSKDKVDRCEETLLESAKRFYIRRTLRIFPIYYLTLITSAMLSVASSRDAFFWNLAYLSNIYVALQGKWPPLIGHLWSLSVEEQFYLLWPWLILLVPRKHLLKFLICVILTGPLYRAGCFIVDASSFITNVITLGTIDLFGIGALLAYLKTSGRYSQVSVDFFAKQCLLAGGIPFLLLLMLKYPDTYNTFYRTFEGFFFLWILHRASDGFTGAAGTVLEWKPLVYLGKVSYGIYVYHNFMPTVGRSLASLIKVGYPSQAFLQFSIDFGLTIFTASLSWYLIEKPLSQFKERFGKKRLTEPGRVALATE
ncbi:MAG TPA: acyltransferase [Geomonas sp.]|nr:acyltransferase [Geomonas sp.]